MTRAKHDDELHNIPKAIIKKMRWPAPLIWLIPVLAAIAAGIYFYQESKNHGPQITVHFSDGKGLRVNETPLEHLGVPLGQVTGIELSNDQRQVLVHIQLLKSNEMYAKKGARFWVVRPEISAEAISGLNTFVSGPYIESLPGNCEDATDFAGLDRAPIGSDDGLTIILHTTRMEHLQIDSPVYFRGIQVGAIKNIQLSQDATQVDISAFIRRRYSVLVKTTSQFWIESGADVKGGLLSGVQVKVDSLRSLITGDVAFATPLDPKGEPAQNGTEFFLHDESKKDWLSWSPQIEIGPEDSNESKEQTREEKEQEKLPSPTKSK